MESPLTDRKLKQTHTYTHSYKYNIHTHCPSLCTKAFMTELLWFMIMANMVKCVFLSLLIPLSLIPTPWNQFPNKQPITLFPKVYFWVSQSETAKVDPSHSSVWLLRSELPRAFLPIWWRRGRMLVAQLCPILGNSMDYSPLGSSVLGILQARLLECVALPCPSPGAVPDEGIKLSSTLQADSLPFEPLGKLPSGGSTLSC